MFLNKYSRSTWLCRGSQLWDSILSFRRLWTLACRENPMFGYKVGGKGCVNGSCMHRERDYILPWPFLSSIRAAGHQNRSDISALIHHTTQSRWFFDGIIMTHSWDLIFFFNLQNSRNMGIVFVTYKNLIIQ